MAGKHRAEDKEQPEDPGLKHAKEARVKAEKSLEEAYHRGRELAYLMAVLERIRERNHLGEMTKDLFVKGT